MMIIQRAEARAERELAQRKRAEAQRARDEVMIMIMMVMVMVITAMMMMETMMTMVMPGTEEAEGGGVDGQESREGAAAQVGHHHVCDDCEDFDHYYH